MGTVIYGFTFSPADIKKASVAFGPHRLGLLRRHLPKLSMVYDYVPVGCSVGGDVYSLGDQLGDIPWTYTVVGPRHHRHIPAAAFIPAAGALALPKR